MTSKNPRIRTIQIRTRLYPTKITAAAETGVVVIEVAAAEGTSISTPISS